MMMLCEYDYVICDVKYDEYDDVICYVKYDEYDDVM